MTRKSMFRTLFLFASVCMTAIAALPQSPWHGNYFPNVVLTNQDGKTVHFYDDLLKGKIVVLDLIYTNCQFACPLETARLAQVQRILGDRVGKDVFFYSISIDPERDTPQQLKEYAEKFHAGPSWQFLTGKKEDIDLISKKLGLYSEPDPTNKDGHTPDVLLGNEVSGQWIRNSALDNPRYLAVMIGDWLNSWKNSKVGTSYTEASLMPVPDQGKQLFKTHCAACHTVGHGDSVGPDLLGVTTVRDNEWLLHFIATPDKVLANEDPIARSLFVKYKQVRMPNLRLSEADVRAVIHYLKLENDAFSRKVADEPGPDKATIAVGMKMDSNMKMDPNMKMSPNLKTDQASKAGNR